MLSVDYESNAAILEESKEIYVAPFSCIAERDVALSVNDVVRRALIVNPDGTEQPSKDALLLSDANDVWLHRQPMQKNATIQQLCKEPLTIEATLHMSNYEYSKIQPFSLIHINGVDYVWTESSWQKGTATLTLSKLPLTLGQVASLPYEWFDYLESDGTNYIQLPFAPTSSDSFELKFSLLTVPSGVNAYIYGCRKASCDHSLQINTNSTIVPRYDSSVHNFGIVPVVGTWYVAGAAAERWKLRQQGGTDVVRTFSAATFTSDVPIVLFGYNNKGTVVPFAMRCGQYMHNGMMWYPCRRTTDNVTGYYCAAYDTFIPSVGGNMTVGSPIPKPF